MINTIVSILLALVCLQLTLALPARTKVESVDTDGSYLSPEEGEEKRQVGFGTALGYGVRHPQVVSAQEKAYQEGYGGKRDTDKRGINFGTAFGHTANDEDSQEDYLSDWQKTYNELYGNKKRQIRFGTALGHSSSNSDQGDYISDQNAMFDQLFGK